MTIKKNLFQDFQKMDWRRIYILKYFNVFCLHNSVWVVALFLSDSMLVPSLVSNSQGIKGGGSAAKIL